MSAGDLKHLSSAAQSALPSFACVIGTRPEVIKMAPIIRQLRDSAWAKVQVVAIGQHLELLDQAIADFDLAIDHHIPIERRRGSMIEVVAQIADRFDILLDQIKASGIIAQGDTSTVMAASVVAFHRRLDFIHIEAGLRTGDLSAPFPEEFNRRVVSLATTLHCAPTEQAAANLRAEGIAPGNCIITGNTVIDALLDMNSRRPPLPAGFPDVARPILVTAHRRENAGAPLARTLQALRDVVDRYADVGVFFPVHPNPDTQNTAHRILGGHPRICLVEPQGYAALVAALGASWIVVTDSGGLQEEAPALGKPVLVLREVTERPESVLCGAAKLVGTNPDVLRHAIAELHDDPAVYAAMATPRFPYGDGKAASRLLAELRRRFSADSRAAPFDATSSNSENPASPLTPLT